MTAGRMIFPVFIHKIASSWIKFFFYPLQRICWIKSFPTPLKNMSGTSKKTYRCFFKNITRNFWKRPMFFQKRPMFFSKQRYVLKCHHWQNWKRLQWDSYRFVMINSLGLILKAKLPFAIMTRCHAFLEKVVSFLEKGSMLFGKSS